MTKFDIKKLEFTSKKKESSFHVFYGKIKGVVGKLKRKNDKFEIYTPTAVVGIRGTTFGVSVKTEDETKVAVFSGEVEVKNKKKMDLKPVIVKSSEKTVII